MGLRPFGFIPNYALLLSIFFLPLFFPLFGFFFFFPFSPTFSSVQVIFPWFGLSSNPGPSGLKIHPASRKGRPASASFNLSLDVLLGGSVFSFSLLSLSATCPVALHMLGIQRHRVNTRKGGLGGRCLINNYLVAVSVIITINYY